MHLRRHAEHLLKQALSNPSATFRDGQWEAISDLVERRARMLVVQRTGWGKSLVYFLATRLLRERGSGPTLLISPLLALMRNQLLAAERIGVRAATINSSNRREWSDVIARLHAGDVDILLITPERLANDEFRSEALRPIADTIGMFVVDEAHCISDWGHDFRPDYRRIVRVLQMLPPHIPMLATTATANNRVVADIRSQLGASLRIVRGPLGRDSLRLQNIALAGQAERLAWLAAHIPALPGSGVVCTLTVRDAQRVAAWLQLCSIDAHAYWGELDSQTREDLEQRLLDNRIKVLVATTALGMGFDKPDLGFVIHFQRPGSVIHYYQQVGRAGRAIDQAYGILLSGEEDQDITDYFITTAFPPRDHIEMVLRALESADDGLTLAQMESRGNLSRNQIEKTLKVLAVETPSPVVKIDTRWFATPVNYTLDVQRIERLTAQRRAEQERMRDYVHSRECLMVFLKRELDDPDPQPCGRCAVCIGRPLVSPTYPAALERRAVAFLRRNDQRIEPRRMWPGDALQMYGWHGKIPSSLMAEEGRALCIWGDAGWGELVKRGKQIDDHFDDALVDALVELVQQRWRPEPAPAWVTCVPSLTHPTLVADMARRLAKRLGLPFVAAVRKVRPTEPQKRMQNSFQQAHNIAGAFVVDRWGGINGPVLLVDDMVDSGWTFTVVAALLREAGSGPVFPLALALVQGY
ncbi:MAG: RecQ family ATP-dependent DNA helicase [Roseiflexus sp.]|nr:RecQ family ATP-dependent DNA helicase [Roseiflexus sp.]MCS7289992.1 RecQ family ATP-dependent DNA helicase [Roseiflexus sp.]MDW8233461.1 RecQ family ATP-dependent DNA helicase [Roseiflexaceae bacterium]